jgi:hypothetical protein
MAPPCDAACQKIIINTGFMSILAPELSAHLKFGDPAAVSASKLGRAAKTLHDMLQAVGIHADSTSFTGCDEAKTLLAWLTGKGVADAKLMDKWTANLWSACSDLAAGKIPA